MKVPIGGGNPTAIVSLEQDTGTRDIAVDATNVYWTKIWKLEHRPKQGGPGEPWARPRCEPL